MQKTRVLVVGGYGFFGRRLVERLSLQAGLHITVAGRSGPAAEALANALRPAAESELAFAELDAMHSGFSSQLKQLGTAIVVNASGPFQGQDYRVAEACIAAGSHYIDLADGREFVAGVGVLNAAAETAGVLITSGASSVPALSSAAADYFAQGLKTVTSIDVGISPGNRTERGLSTVQAILSYCGKPLPSPANKHVIGWSGAYRHTYPTPVGSRLHSPCDVPDLALLPARYAGHPDVRFGAGLELEFLHRGMNVMAWMAQRGWVKSWAIHASLLKRAADLFQNWGTDGGAMHVSLVGVSNDGQPVSRAWQLVAIDGDGPYVPTLAASALVRKLASDNTPLMGAKPCVGLLSLADFALEMHGLKISTSETY